MSQPKMSYPWGKPSNVLWVDPTKPSLASKIDGYLSIDNLAVLFIALPAFIAIAVASILPDGKAKDWTVTALTFLLFPYTLIILSPIVVVAAMAGIVLVFGGRPVILALMGVFAAFALALDIAVFIRDLVWSLDFIARRKGTPA